MVNLQDDVVNDPATICTYHSPHITLILNLSFRTQCVSFHLCCILHVSRPSNQHAASSRPRNQLAVEETTEPTSSISRPFEDHVCIFHPTLRTSIVLCSLAMRRLLRGRPNTNQQRCTSNYGPATHQSSGAFHKSA